MKRILLCTLVVSATLVSLSLKAKTYYLRTEKAFSENIGFKKKSSTVVEFEVSIGQFEAEPFKATPLRGEFQRFEVVGLKNSQTPGAPELPYKSFIVKGSPNEIKVTSSFVKKHFFKGLKAKPAPLKPCRCEKDLKSGQVLFPFKANAYQQEEDQLVELVDLGDFRGERLTQVIIRPLLQGDTGITVYEDLEVMVENSQGITNSDFKEANKKMLLIAPRSLMSGASRFKAFKEESGFQVSQYAWEDIAADANGLKSFIHSTYQREKFQYAVLVGHEQTLPTLSVPTSSDPQTPSDYPYFTMGGAQDIFPDVFYGRLVASSNDEIDVQIAKMREYRDQSWANNRGIKSAIGMASNEGWNPTDVEYMQQMIGPLENSLGFQTNYYFQENSNAMPRNINRTFNQGIRWFNYIGHGSGHSWSAVYRGEYTVNDLKGLRPGAVKPIVIDVACQNGRFNQEGRLGELLMNKTYQNQPVGAVAYYGGSVDISWDPPAVMAVAISEEVARQTTASLFEVILKGQKYLIENYEDIEASRENLLWYHLFGDPSLKVTGL